MKKRPFEVVTEDALNALKKTSENLKFNFIQQDQILVWILGFSIAATTFLISNFSSANFSFDCCIIRLVLILLCVSIISGIFYRIFSLSFLAKHQQIIIFLEAAFSKNEMMRIDPEELTSDLTIDQIHQRIEVDFGKDYKDILDLYNDAQSEEKREGLKTYLKNEYKGLAAWTKNEYEYSVNYVRNTQRDAFGLTEKEMEKIEKDTKYISTHLKRYGFLSKWSFILSILSFILVLIILVISYF